MSSDLAIGSVILTGTNGKTTTTTMIYEVMKKANLPVILAGNIGYPLASVLDKIKENVSEGEVVLLSPACASWDQYAKFEDRRDEFKKYCEEIK